LSRDRERVRVRNSEVLSHKVLMIRKVPIEVGVARSKTVAKHLFGFLRYPLVEDGSKGSLVHLARKEVEPRLQLGALDRAVEWRQSFGRDLIGSVVEQQSRHVA
jgi:hypothetical protein